MTVRDEFYEDNKELIDEMRGNAEERADIDDGICYVCVEVGKPPRRQRFARMPASGHGIQLGGETFRVNDIMWRDTGSNGTAFPYLIVRPYEPMSALHVVVKDSRIPDPSNTVPCGAEHPAGSKCELAAEHLGNHRRGRFAWGRDIGTPGRRVT